MAFGSTARLWDAATLQPIGLPLKHDNYVNAVAFSPDGKTFLTGSRDKTARFWDVPETLPPEVVLPHKAPVTAVAFSPDGKLLCTGGGEIRSTKGDVQLWEAATGKPVGDPLLHPGMVSAVAFSPDGSRLLTGSWPKSVQLWEVATRKPLGRPRELQQPDGIWAVAFGPEAHTIQSMDTQGMVRLWDSTTGKLIREQRPNIGIIEVVSADGKRALSGAGEDNTAMLIQIEPRKLIGNFQHDGELMAVAFRPDGAMLLTGGADGAARLWDADALKRVGPRLRHQGPVSAAAFGP